MNATLVPVRSLDSDRLLLTAASTTGAHLTLTERLELRVGLWLLLRSARRRDTARAHLEHHRVLVNSRTRADLEHAALRSLALGSVRT